MTLPLTVIGGYLGAGKTTLLNHIRTEDHGRRFAVIVNDFGAVNVDASLIADHDGDTIALTNGCICCSATDGTAEVIARILRRSAEFDHIIIEASGVAEPGKVARNAAGFRLPLAGAGDRAGATAARASVRRGQRGRGCGLDCRAGRDA